MPRKRPRLLRTRTTPSSRLGEQRGLPAATAEALAALDEPGLEPAAVADELRTWQKVVSLPESVLSAPHNDWVEFIGPMARSVLDAADHALSRRAGAPFRAQLARLDAEFARKTSANPFADPALPWWARRWWH